MASLYLKTYPSDHRTKGGKWYAQCA